MVFLDVWILISFTCELILVKLKSYPTDAVLLDILIALLVWAHPCKLEGYLVQGHGPCSSSRTFYSVLFIYLFIFGVCG